MEIPIVVAVCVLVGCLLRAIWGWLNSGEVFNARKFAATIIFTLFAVGLPTVTSLLASDIIVVGPYGLFGIGLTALLAGWGADSGLKEISKLTTSISKPKITGGTLNEPPK